MYEIATLKTKKLPELQDIAKKIGIKGIAGLKKLDLIYQIVDFIASRPEEDTKTGTSKEKTTSGTEKKGQIKILPVQKSKQKPKELWRQSKEKVEQKQIEEKEDTNQPGHEIRKPRPVKKENSYQEKTGELISTKTTMTNRASTTKIKEPNTKKASGSLQNEQTIPLPRRTKIRT